MSSRGDRVTLDGWLRMSGGRTYSEVTSRGLFQCSACRHQTSPIAGTNFASTHPPLRVWFRVMYHLTQS
jgi:hypothetical protein